MTVELEGSGLRLGSAEAKVVLHEGDEGGGDGATSSQGYWVVEKYSEVSLTDQRNEISVLCSLVEVLLVVVKVAAVPHLQDV
jgi:hypothetical protein